MANCQVLEISETWNVDDMSEKVKQAKHTTNLKIVGSGTREQVCFVKKSMCYHSRLFQTQVGRKICSILFNFEPKNTRCFTILPVPTPSKWTLPIDQRRGMSSGGREQVLEYSASRQHSRGGSKFLRGLNPFFPKSLNIALISDMIISI